MTRSVRLKRIYDPPADDDGTRVLVDRVWPRGVSKADANWDRWDKDVAPSTALRTWYGHDPARFAEFAARYRDELRDSATLGELRRIRGRITLLTATKDLEHSQAAVLAAVLRGDGDHRA